MKQNTYKRTIVIAVAFLLLFTSITISTSSINTKEIENEKTIKINIINMVDNQISQHDITIEDYNILFEKPIQINTPTAFTANVKEKINLLESLQLISNEQSRMLQNRFDSLENKYSDNQIDLGVFGFDAINLFNGILFNMKGEKLTSILDLYVLNLPILKSNISALFSAFSEFQGNGFVISIGALGYQSIVSFSMQQDPRFALIHGSIIGFTGILIISEKDTSEPNTVSILGIGLNVLTYWNKMDIAIEES